MKQTMRLNVVVLTLLIGTVLASAEPLPSAPAAPIIPPGARLGVYVRGPGGAGLVDIAICQMVTAALRKAGVRAVACGDMQVNSGAADVIGMAAAGKVAHVQYVLGVRISPLAPSRTGNATGQPHPSAVRMGLDARFVSVANTVVMRTEAVEATQDGAGDGTSNEALPGRLISGGIDIQSKEWRESPLGRAASRAVDALVRLFAGPPVPGSGIVLAIAGDHTLIVNVGAADGIRVGDTLAVRRATEVYSSQGAVVWSDASVIGLARIVAVRGDCAMAEPVDATEVFREEDSVRLQRAAR
jgi:hypothetical protein